MNRLGYMLWESIVTNCTYYVGWFIFYKLGIWTPSLSTIAVMFGAGCAFDAIVSGVAYAVLLKKHGYNILEVETIKE